MALQQSKCLKEANIPELMTTKKEPSTYNVENPNSLDQRGDILLQHQRLFSKEQKGYHTRNR